MIFISLIVTVTVTKLVHEVKSTEAKINSME
jgi:hypothetical protein